MEPSVTQITMVGVDLAKTVFQIHAIDAEGGVLRRQLRRHEVLAFFAGLQPCVVAMEACGTAHHWAREIAALGHETRLVPASYAKAYVRRGKSDAIDAAAIAEAAGRPDMRFVPVKGLDQQALATLHRTRSLLIKQRTALVNALRSHLAEYGFIVPKGVQHLREMVRIVAEAPAERLPELARRALAGLVEMLNEIARQTHAIDKDLLTWHRGNALSQRLETVPGIGPLTASALTGLVPAASHFRNGRHLAAWLGITPRQDSTGGKTRLKGISKAGDGYLRRLLVLGATSLLRHLSGKTTRLALWVQALIARRPRKLVIVALANKLARIAWAIMASGQAYRAEGAAA
jgi:transposase